jgi:plasmid stabilization system protein ParE
VRPLTPRAQSQVEALIEHYEARGYDGALRNLADALRDVSAKIEAADGLGLTAPRPYPDIAHLNLGFRWLKMGSYWFAFTPAPEMLIAGVFHEASDIPRRL